MVNRNLIIGIAAISAIIILTRLSGAEPGPTPPTLKKAKEYKAIPVKVTKRIHIPKWYHEGLFFDGKNIWVANGKNGKIWVVEPESGKTIGTIDPVGEFTEAVTGGPGERLFVTDWDDKVLYKVHIEGSRMVKESEIPLGPAYPAGVVWNGTHFFVIVWERGIWTKFYILKLDGDGKVIDKIQIKGIQEPAHAAWDGTHLWITSWYSKMVYKIDMSSYEIVGAFPAPVSKATGIAWDGRCFWVTGTDGDLYQLEVM